MEKHATIDIHGAREHNLKNINVQLPKDKLIVFTGVSGSGKSSLAMDTLYAEGQRRYIESLSAYARQFLGQLHKPEVDEIVGLSPSIAIDQGSTGHNPRSTVATVTEVYDYLRVLYARVGQFHCPECGQPVGSQSASDIQNAILGLPPRTRILILAPIVRRRRGEHRLAFADALKAGFVRARIDGDIHEIRPAMSLNPNQRHDIDIVVDRIIVKAGVEERVAEAVEQGLKLGNDSLIVHIVGAERARGHQDREGAPTGLGGNSGEDRLFSTEYVCGQCGISYEVPEPRHFSYNTPEGQCLTCRGLGSQKGISPALIVPDETLSIRDGAIALWGKPDIKQNAVIRSLARHLGFEADAPWKELAPEHQHAILYGTGDTLLSFTQLSAKGGSRLRRYRGRFQGIIPAQEQVYQGLREEDLPEFFVDMPCRDCNGSRLIPAVNAVTLNGTPITEVLAMSIEDAAAFFNALELPPREAFIATELLKEIRGRLGFLQHVGLGYLTLSRSAPTLSGGESQRIRLASQVGAGLRDVTYVLDEPSIGLHARDNAGLLSTLINLRNQGNTVIVVEHDEATIRVADWIVDFGPGAGVKGGTITAMGTPEQIRDESDSLTAQYLRGDKQIVQPKSRRPGNEKWLQICGARQNNLKGIHPKIPLGTLCCVTGVSGSGKSSLVHDILYNALARDLMRAKTVPGAYEKIHGLVLTEKRWEEKAVPVAEVVDKIIHIDMAPIGRTPRSNPATYTKVFDVIRSFYANLPASKLRGYKPGRFSFNVIGGRCEACSGNGAKKVDMGLLSDVWVECEICEGHRYNSETLTVRYKDKSIADVLEMDVDVALAHFMDIPKIARPLKLLHDVGLDYIKLGQPAPTLSGGEAQRIKLSRELAKRSTGKTLYLLDEPTTGLHFDDVNKLLSILHRLVDAGNTVVVVEHNLEVIQSADYLIDLGPEGGVNGGSIVAVGTPEEVAEVPESYTGQALCGQFHIENVVLGNVDESLGKTTCTPQDNMSERIANNKNITVRGAEENNLKNIDVDIPHGQLTVLTGVSGSGKTSLALDTLYAEGQRRYIETLNTYARQFIGQMEKPKVAKIDGLSPAIAISHTSPTQQPRSTVATITEIHDGLRALYARWGQPRCPDCLEPVLPQTAEEIAETVFAALPGKYVHVLAPLTNYRMSGRNVGMDIDATPGLKGNEDFPQAFLRLQREGFARVQINGKMHRLDEAPFLHKGIRQEVLLVIDRVELVAEEKSRFMEAVELALAQGEGFVAIQESRAGKIKNVVIDSVDDGTGGELSKSKRRHAERIATYEKFFSEHAVCPSCGSNFPQLTPRHFSFNNKLGACGFCDGLGRQPLGTTLTGEQLPAVCTHCDGTRLQPFPSHVVFCEKTIAEVMNLSITEIIQFFGERVAVIETELAANPESAKSHEEVKGPKISRATHPSLHTHTSPQFEAEVLRHIQTRLRFLEDIGLGYLELARPAPTLSGGEIRRIRLASQLGSGLTGVTYILDEPSIGLHPRDQGKLITAMKALRDIGNSVLVVEHDKDTILAADHLIDFGPRAGEHGGEIVAAGEPDVFTSSGNVLKARPSLQGKGENGNRSLTQAYLSNALQIPVPKKRREGIGKSLTLTGVQTNNLKAIDVTFPLGTLIAVTGVSGCGKSSLIDGTLRPALESRRTVQAEEVEGEFDYERYRQTVEERQQQGKPVYQGIHGVTAVKRLINVGQQPIGETPRSNLATYTELFTKIRAVFAEQPDAQRLGFGMARFSFNLNYGQCEQCGGHRFNRVEMHFLPDVWIPCEACGSTGYNADTLSVRYKGKNIAEVLQLTVAEALELFSDVNTVGNNIRHVLEVLTAVGLDYLALGQPATTLSGGEAQRIKLAKELARRHVGSTLYLMDEPTTGLHVDDVQKLLKVLDQLVDAGNTIIAVEHNLDVIKSADWVIDLGPEGSKGGGEIVATGTPEEIASVWTSHTGRFLREVLS